MKQTPALARAKKRWYEKNKEEIYQKKMIYRMNLKIERFFNDWKYKF
jgi:hypothetical protein